MKTPAVVTRPIWLALNSVNQRLPSGPSAMSLTNAFAVGTGSSVTTPAVVMRPMALAPAFVNQSAPSGPFAIETLPPVVGNSVI